MRRREIVLDTETTGIDPRAGHRIIEIACVELDDRLPTGRTFHRYVNPDREIEAGAERVHGISNQFIRDKPRFADPVVVEEFLDFVADTPIIAHNAAFDRGFVNHELERIARRPIEEKLWVCSYKLAQSKFPGAYNSLDALCKRYKISLAEREKHGALIDARLLAAVYFQLLSAEIQALDLAGAGAGGPTRRAYGPRPRPLPSRITELEAEAHAAFVRDVLKDKAVWLKLQPA